MRIVTLSDLHVRHGATLPETVTALAWILASIRARPAAELPDVIVLGGDLFDTAATAEALLALCSFVQEAADICEVVVIYGNHERQRELDVLARLSATHPITVYDKPAVHRIPGLALALIPWIDRVIPIADLGGYSLEQEKSAEEKRLNEILDALRVELDAIAQPGDARVCVGHLMLDVAIGALANPGQPDPKGKEFIVSLAQLARLGCQVVALGHVHDGREWEIPGRDPGDAPAPLFYNGSTRCWGWGEILGKRFATIEVTGDATIPARVTFTAIPGRAMIQLDDVWMAGPEAGAAWGWKSWTGIDGELDDGEAVGAVVRFTYEVPASRADEARAAAAKVVKALYGAGAHHVQPAPKVQPEQRPRRPEMARAKTLEDKLDVFVVGRGGDPDADHVTRARRHLSALRLEAGVAGRLAAGGMRLGSIEARGMRAFRDPVKLDVEALPGQVVAMVGPNGAGKSTLLACWMGAQHRSTARTDLRRLALKDADPVVITTTMVNGEWVALEHQFARDKSFARKVNAPPGTPPEASGFKGFQTWADANLLPEDVARNAIFAGQGSAGLLALGPPERRDPMLKALGLGPLKKLHALALAKAKEAAKVASTARGVLDAARIVRAVEVPPMPAAGSIGAARLDVLRLEQEVQQLDGEERCARAAAETLAFAVSVAADTRRSLGAERDRSAAALRGLEEQLAEHRGILARAEEIRAADVQVIAIRAEIVTFDAAITAGEAATRAAAIARDARLKVESEASTAIDRLIAKIAGAARILADRAEIESAAADLAGAEEALARAVAAHDAAQRDLAEAQRETATRATTRAGNLRGGIDEVIASSAIDEAHAAAIAAGEADDLLIVKTYDFEWLDRAVKLAFAARAMAEVQARNLRGLAAKLPEITRADEDTATWAIEKESLEGVRASAHIEAAEHDRVRCDAVSARLAAEKELAAARARLAPLDSAAALAGALARAEASADTLSAPIAARRVELEGIDQRIADLPAPPVAPAGPTAEALLAQMQRARDEANTAREIVRAAELADARRVAAEVAAEDARRIVAEAEAALVNPAAEEAAWDLLVAFLGPRGLQTIEIDVACPELSAILRELLGCFGTRWSMSVEASRPNSDGSGEVDAITFPTIDNESDDTEPRDASCFSGGQAVPLAFAIRVALAVLVALRTGTTLPTLVFDEPTAALHDTVDFERLMAMIRRAAAMIGAGKVIIVSHSLAFVELADCAIVVGGGKIEVISPARIPEA